MVMSPRRRRRGHVVMMCLARVTSSEPWCCCGSGAGARGVSPDFASSPEVFTCKRMLSGAVRSAGSARSSAVAAFADVTVWMVWMLGMAAKTNAQRRASAGSVSLRMTGEEEGRTCEGLGLVGLQRADEVPSDVRGQLAAHDHRCKLACVHPGGIQAGVPAVPSLRAPAHSSRQSRAGRRRSTPARLTRACTWTRQRESVLTMTTPA